MNPQEHEQFQQLTRKIDPQSNLLRAWELKGGVSAQVTALEIERPGGEMARMVVRRHGAVDLQNNPAIAADEFKLLQALHGAGLPVPEPYYVDRSGEIFPTPSIVVEYIDGAPEFSPANVKSFVREMAAQLARIHSLDFEQLDLSFLPKQEEQHATTLRKRLAEPDLAPDQRRIWETLESASPPPPWNPPALLHGDFWPGNLLWRDGNLVAIIDWEDAAIGDPLSDLANSRLEILWALGAGAIQDFTRHYQTLMAAIDFANLPYWDLYVAARVAPKISGWGLAEAEERAMRDSLHLFITRAYQALES